MFAGRSVLRCVMVLGGQVLKNYLNNAENLGTEAVPVVTGYDTRRNARKSNTGAEVTFSLLCCRGDFHALS